MPQAPFRTRLAQWLDLPRDVVLNLPRISVVGDLQILVQNHRGVMEYTPQRIVIGMEHGAIEITGDDLAIGNIHNEEVNIAGRLKAIQLLRTEQ